MSANDPRDSADALGKSPVDSFPSESSPPIAPQGDAPGAIDEFVRGVRSRAAASGTPVHDEPQLGERAGGIARYVRTHPLHLVAAAAAAVVVTVVVRAWPTIGESAGILGSRLLTALTPTRLVEVPADDAAAAADTATAAKPRRATRTGPTADAPRVPGSAPAAPSGDQTIAASSDTTRASDTPSAAPLARDNDVGGADFVYSSADADVRPPKLISEGPGQPAKVMSERTRVLELLVMPDGSVDHVRLRSTEAQLMDPILLSRAKMWQFDPAQRGGRAVPYRLVLLWDTPR